MNLFIRVFNHYSVTSWINYQSTSIIYSIFFRPHLFLFILIYSYCYLTYLNRYFGFMSNFMIIAMIIVMMFFHFLICSKLEYCTFINFIPENLTNFSLILTITLFSALLIVCIYQSLLWTTNAAWFAFIILLFYTKLFLFFIPISLLVPKPMKIVFNLKILVYRQYISD